MSPDGVHVLGTGTNEVRVWEFETDREVRRYTFTTTIWGAAFSPDGSRIAFGSYDGDGVYVVQTDLEDEIRALCARLSRDFTAEERALYNVDDTDPTCPTV
jgi:WD40 repeat protein